ncbi:hypothetical protein LMH87_010967 [Akanthomyces muscarius]|uniref:CAP domain protein n=2 Tax=Akanthomyces TaxID=150366 RepID=A0A162KS10_CORDF|nr:hypothetical protein LMH87_010967 [Akanthomyces muscarius]KAJ4150208.1 hypothetical protein LMH87_010967 [Akanthomyces muscarius]OAA78988.1 CAP domain protein [Akanthomyces lecanii RCEF 1005]
MSTNVLTKAAVLALAAIGSVSAAPLEVRAHEDFQEMMLKTTNWYRSQHGAEPVSWDQGLADYAVNYANTCAKGHSGGGHGENLAWGSGWANWANLFGNERVKFDFDNGEPGRETGHFTQLVWKSTSRMGCGWAWCDNFGEHFVVCSYEKPGNWGGQVRQNVGHQIQGSPNDQFPG